MLDLLLHELSHPFNTYFTHAHAQLLRAMSHRSSCPCIPTTVGCCPLQFTAEPMDAVVTPKGVATLECQTSEASVTVTWYKSDGTPIATSGGGKYSQLTDGNLQIASFTSDDVGMYYCVVQNSEGSVQSRNAQLQIACECSC